MLTDKIVCGAKSQACRYFSKHYALSFSIHLDLYAYILVYSKIFTKAAMGLDPQLNFTACSQLSLHASQALLFLEYFSFSIQKPTWEYLVLLNTPVCMPFFPHQKVNGEPAQTKRWETPGLGQLVAHTLQGGNVPGMDRGFGVPPPSWAGYWHSQWSAGWQKATAALHDHLSPSLKPHCAFSIIVTNFPALFFHLSFSQFQELFTSSCCLYGAR